MWKHPLLYHNMTHVSWILTVIAAITWYRPTAYNGVTYCGNDVQELIDSGIVWVAVDVGLYESGRVRCGDEIQVRFSDGIVLYALALDSGPLADYYIVDYGPSRPIIADIPDIYWPYDHQRTSSLGGVMNWTEFEKVIERHGLIP
jgi:hypothetical protein